MIKYLSSKVLPLTHELADTFAAMPALPGERPLKPARMEFLRQRLAEGTFYPPRWARTMILSTGQIARVNGQHSSTLLRDLPEIPPGTRVILDEFECENEKDAANLFMQFDAPESVRGLADIERAHSRTHPDLSEVSDRAIGRVMKGVVLGLKLSTGVKKISLHQKGRLVHNAVPFIQWASRLLGVPVLDRAPSLAAMQMTFDADAEKSKSFWQAVADESDPDNNHPTRLVKRMLQDLLAAPVGTRARAKHKLDDRAVVARCLYGWNAYIDGKKITSLRYTATDEFLYAHIPESAAAAAAASAPAPVLQEA